MKDIKQFRDRFSQHPPPPADVLPKLVEQAFGGRLRFEIESADIVDPAGTPLHGRKRLENLADEGREFRVTLTLRPVATLDETTRLKIDYDEGWADAEDDATLRRFYKRCLKRHGGEGGVLTVGQALDIFSELVEVEGMTRKKLIEEFIVDQIEEAEAFTVVQLPSSYENAVSSSSVAAASSSVAREPEPLVAVGSARTVSDEAIRQAIEKLRRLELEAKLPFVALRYFRDRHLNGDHQLLRTLRDSGVLSFSKTENPNAPDHPVTTIRANRAHPLVREVYEKAHEGRPQGPARRRIQIQGTPLSQMIVADRR